jgi:hypothetical protein
VELGKRLFTLWRLRPWLVVSVLLATIVAVWSVAKISLFPPGLTSRSLEMATATTHVVVDTPHSSVLDLRQNTYDFQALTQRAVLLGNVIANGSVRATIAARAHVPVDVLQVAPPLTPKQPEATLGTGNPAPSVGDIAKSTDQYRLSIQADPTVPVLDIYAQAPTAAAAAALANGAVDGLREYLAGLAATQQTPSKDQVQLLQLGPAHGTVINNGIEWQVAVLAFILTLAIASATGVFFSRVSRGWRMAALAEQRAGG